jgi:signal transduction histidine kinase
VLGDELRFEVIDDGPGLPEEMAERAFEPFVSTRAGSGAPSGLGLGIVRSLTEAQGGTVDLHTSTAGTAVTLRFPIASN